jgi:hypothetical protein
MGSSYAMPAPSGHKAVWGGLYDSAFSFSNVSVAAAFITGAGVRLHLLNLTRAGAQALGEDTLQCSELLKDVVTASLRQAKIVCRSLEYLYVVDGRLMARLIGLFAFDAAWSTFKTLQAEHGLEVSCELGWCRSTAGRIEPICWPVFCHR